MCGIVGYIGKENALPVILDVLESLECQDHDSPGVLFQNGKGIEVYGTNGKTKELRDALSRPLPRAKLGLGQMTACTSPRGSRPAQSFGGVAVVHSGIIENYRELRAMLADGAYDLSADIDIIPALIARYLSEGRSAADAVSKTACLLKGTYALGVFCESCPATLFALKCCRPLTIAGGRQGYLFSSNTAALMPYSRRFLFLRDRQICVLTPDGIQTKAYDPPGTSPSGLAVRPPGNNNEAKERYDHFMLKEIYEQPEAVSDTLREWIDDPARLLRELGMARMTRQFRRLHIVGCGTSYHVGLLGRYILERFVHMPVTVDIASEYSCMNPTITKGALFVAVTQSGETAATVTANREAHGKGAFTLALCNRPDSTAAREADSVLYTRAGREMGKAPTKSFAAQLAALVLLGVAIGTEKGRLTQLEIETLKSLLVDLPCLIRKALGSDCRIREIAETMVQARQILYLGSGINYPVALEGALKMKEVAHLPAEGHPAGEMRHGPISLVEKGVPVIVLAPLEALHEKVLSNIHDILARKGRIVAITDAPAALRDKVEDIIGLPPAHPALSPFVNVIPLQLLACHVALGRGCEVDLADCRAGKI